MSAGALALSVVIPAYNEQDRLPKTLERLAAWRPASFDPVQIIVVDDGSADGTVSVVREFMKRDPRLEVIPTPHGGAMHAVIIGYKAARNEVVANMDADGATDPSEFEGFASHLSEADVVTGSRQLRGSLPPIEGKSFFRRVISKGFSGLFLLLFRIGVHDPQIGCRMFKREALLKILPLVTSRHDGIKLAEILVKAYGLGYAIKEVPVRYRHDEDSRLVPRRPWRVIAKVFAALLGMWMDAAAQFYAAELSRQPVRLAVLARGLDALCGRAIRNFS